jgi:hypothetical protein
VTSNRLREIFSDFDFTKIIGMCADWTKSDDKGNPNPSFNLKRLGEGREIHRQNWFSWMMRMWIDDNGVLVLYRPSEYIATKSIIKIWNHLTNFLIKKGIQEKIQLYIVNNNCSRVNSVVQYPQEFFQIKKDKQKIENINYDNLKVYEFNFDFCLTEYCMWMDILSSQYGVDCIPSVTNLTEDEKTFDKPYKFFTLMGDSHPHRTSLYDMLVSENLKQYGLISAWWKNEFLDVRSYRYDMDNRPNNVIKNSTSTKHQLMEDGEWEIFKSLPIPIYYSKNIYKNCYLQLISESRMNVEGIDELNDKNHYTFLTEKTAKSLCSNPFILYGQPHSLKYLHGLGFKTFDGLIDESYDDISDADKRLSFLHNQVKSLLQGDDKRLKEIYLESLPILEHNFDVLLKINWQRNVQNLVQLIDGKIT